ncbi:MAG: ATP-binding protein [Hyphomicrobium sp.]
MRFPSLTLRLGKTERELALLLLASLGCVLVLTAGIASGSGAETAGGVGAASGRLLAFGLVMLALLAAGAAVLEMAARSRRRARAAEDEVRSLRQRLATTEALIRAEPQVLVYWEHGQSPRVVTQTLAGIAGLPTSEVELLRFNMWLDQKSAEELRHALDALFVDGRAFNAILRTEAGGHIEADGRAAGGRAVLRVRDVAGYKRDLGTIADRHASLAREIRASRALLDALPVPVWLRDGEGRISWVNRAYAAAVEASGEGEVRERQIELIESRQRKAIERALARGETYIERIPLIIGGERKSHDVRVLPIDGATAGAAMDVAALEFAQGELERLVSTYDRTLDRVATAVAIFSPERRLTFFNQAYQDLWKLDAEWLRSGPADGAVLDKLRELGRLPEAVHYRVWKAELLDCYAAPGPREHRWDLPDGRIVQVIAEQRPDGGVTYLYADETERYALKSQYNALISVQSETLDSLAEGVAVFGIDGRLQLFNAAFASIWKLSSRALAEGPHVDAVIRDVRVLYPDAATWVRIANAVTAFYSQREPLDGQMVRPDSSVIDFAAMPLPDGGTLLTFADVTVSKSYERALEERNEALVAADRIKNQFIGNVSYELRTPLTNIIGFSEMLASPFMGTLSDKQREYIDDIMSSSKTLLAIIDDILDLATIDAGALELKRDKVDVREVIRSAIMGIRDRAIRSGLTLDIAIAEDLTVFQADEQRVRQVLFNVLSNAVGFSKAGGVVHLSCWRENGWVTCAIQDQGVGIPKEQQVRAFDRFESRSQGSKHRGAGLGLAIVKHIVELHGGDVKLESEPGVGTRVTVRFPERGAGHAVEEAAPAHDFRAHSLPADDLRAHPH